VAAKPKLAMYWAASCGGCEISLINLHENILELDRHFDFVFCPCLLDTKIADVESWPDGAIALTLFNGAIRTDENLEMALLLRRKTATLIAFGACAATGGIPALSNLHSRAAHFASIYGEGPSLDNAAGRLPSVHTAMPEGDLELPGFHGRVKRLEEVVAVDYTIPGCPPEPHQIWNVMRAVIEGAPLPPRGSVLGAGQSTVCEECLRPKQEKRIAAFRRNSEVVPDATTCLLEQGMLCMGPATRDGCGALCPRANMPCTGCYGPPEGVRDQGAKMIAALGSVVDFENCRGSDEERLAERIDSVCDSLPDAAGTFYRYTLAAPILDRR
jgi:F420-non-reducing hydrogenase small subunit